MRANANSARLPARGRRAWRFASSELRALRELRRRVGIHRAIVARVKSNLELDGVDEATMSTLVADLEATRAECAAVRAECAAARSESAAALAGCAARLAEYAATLARNERELGAARETLAAHVRLTDAIAAHIDLHEPAATHVAGPAMLERLLALGYWLDEQPPSDLLVSVIIPTRSRPAMLRQAIASVQGQSHADWEIIVVDDGSEDDTRATLAAIEDSRVRCLRTDGLGPAGARTAGLKLARGDAIAYLDDDNIMLPGWLAAVAWAFSRFDGTDVLYGARVVEDETPFVSDARLPRLAFGHFDRSRLLQGNYIDTNVIAHRANLPEARWDPDLAGIADWDLIIRLTDDKPALALPVAAVLYRTGAPDRMSHTAGVRESEQKLRARLRFDQR